MTDRKIPDRWRKCRDAVLLVGRIEQLGARVTKLTCDVATPPHAHRATVEFEAPIGQHRGTGAAR